MNINPKDRRNYHHLSVEQKRQLFTAIHKAVKECSNAVSYYRMFTEPRAEGYRCKLWYGKVSDGWMNTIADRIYSEIQKTPFGPFVSHVEAYRVKAQRNSCRYNNDPAFYIKFN